jgi:hypothetical protein
VGGEKNARGIRFQERAGMDRAENITALKESFRCGPTLSLHGHTPAPTHEAQRNAASYDQSPSVPLGKSVIGLPFSLPD